MGEQTVVVGDVIRVRDGVTNNHPWTIWKVTDGNGSDLGSCLDDVANAARPLIGKRAVVVNEVETTQKDGKTYNNLKLRSVEPAQEETAAGGNGDVDWDGKDKRICRQACLKVAAVLAPQVMLAPDKLTVPDVLALAGKLENWVYRGFDDVVAVEFPVPAGGFTGSDSPPLSDDDIPFAYFDNYEQA